jgi:trimeric autotransporter adhesin
MRFFKIILSISLLITISACDSSSGGAPKAADITASNSQKLSIAATEGARQAVSTDTANSANPFASFTKTSASQFNSKAFSEKLSSQIQLSTDLGALCSSGSYTSTLSQASTSGSITFNNCNLSSTDVGFDIIVSGTVNITSTNNSFSLTYSNFTVTSNGTTETISFSFSCTNLDTTFDCTSSSSINGIDNRTYTVNDISVTTNPDLSYNVSAEVVDPDFGVITISAQSVVFNCTAAPTIDRPSSGTITITAAGKTATVTFNSCNSYTVTLDGVANIYSWVTL